MTSPSIKQYMEIDMIFSLIADICTQQLDTEEHVKDLSTYSQDMTKRKIVKARGGFFYLRKKKYFLCYLRTWRLPVAESIPQQSDHIMIANR